MVQQTRLLTRDALLDSLDSLQKRRLVLLTAPAGYGKSTLLGQWRDRLLKRGRRVAWLSLDDDDGNPGDLVTCFLHSLRRAGVKLAPDLIKTAILDEATAKHRLRQLLNSIASDGVETVLMLDEVEHLPGPTVETIMTPLLRWAPENLRLVIAARRVPPLPLATLRAQGLLAELRATELRFTQDEISELFGPQLSRQDLSNIDRQTEGWPVALQLLRGSTHPTRSLSLSPAHEDISAYLSEQIFAVLPRPLHDFLIEASILDRLSLGAVERVLGHSDGWRALLETESLKPFLISVDRDVGAYRLHPIIRETLSAAFSSLPPARQTEIHRAAALWHAQGQHLPRALRHALLAGDLDLAGQLVVEAGALQIWIRHGFARLKAIDELLSDDLLARFPRLKLLRALVLAKDGANAATRRLFETVRTDTQDFTFDASGGDPAILRLDGLVVESTLMFNEGRAASDAYLDAYERTVHSISGDDHVFQAHVKNLLCISCVQRGLFDRAVAASHEAIDHYRQAGLFHGEFYSHLHLGVINMAQGMADAAETSYGRAQAIARKHFTDDRPKNMQLNTLLAELAYESNNLPLAERRLRSNGDQLRHSEGWYDIYAAQHVTNTMTALASQGLDAALNQIDSAWHMASERHIPGLKPLLDATRVSCLALSGFTDEAAAAAHAGGLVLSPETPHQSSLWREEEAVLTALARLALRQGEAAKLAIILPPQLQRLRARRHVRSSIRIGTLTALAFADLKDTETALGHLGTVLALSARSGYQRMFHEEGAAMVPLLKQYLLNSHSDITARSHAADILAVLDVGSRASKSYTALSPREVQVLRQLALGQSDKLIGRALTLTENTVKYHLKNVYSKLSVSSRTEAVQAAKRHGLI
nr:LuxR C-terminal-related transcriptional regulator [Govania unica]